MVMGQKCFSLNSPEPFVYMIESETVDHENEISMEKGSGKGYGTNP